MGGGGGEGVGGSVWITHSASFVILLGWKLSPVVFYR